MQNNPLLDAALRVLQQSGEKVDVVFYVNGVQESSEGVIQYADDLYRAEKGKSMNERAALLGKPRKSQDKLGGKG